MLTRKQYELLRFINERLKEAGVPPSFDEMKDALDLRTRLEEREDGTLVAHPVNHQDSSLLANLAAAQALLVRAPFAPKAEAGTLCEVLRLPV